MKMISQRRPGTIFATLFGLALASLIATGCKTSTTCKPAVQTKESQQAMTPTAALERLKAGNDRFVAGQPLHRDFVAERTATAKGQYPFAVVLNCLDSRSAAEQIFDQGIGDVFSARVAGNILNDDILGSMEFACKAAGAKLIVVVGHTKCGAIKGACADVQLGNLTGLLDKIKPAATTLPADAKTTLSKDAYVDAVAAANVKLVMQQIKERSPILAEMIQAGQVGLAGGVYDLESGKVAFLP